MGLDAMSDDKIVMFDKTKTIALPGEPCPGVIDLLEGLLARAKTGEISGVICSYTVEKTGRWEDRCLDSGWAAASNIGFDLLASLREGSRAYEAALFDKPK